MRHKGWTENEDHRVHVCVICAGRLLQRKQVNYSYKFCRELKECLLVHWLTVAISPKYRLSDWRFDSGAKILGLLSIYDVFHTGNQFSGTRTDGVRAEGRAQTSGKRGGNRCLTRVTIECLLLRLFSFTQCPSIRPDLKSSSTNFQSSADSLVN